VLTALFPTQQATFDAVLASQLAGMSPGSPGTRPEFEASGHRKMRGFPHCFRLRPISF
jgi:hypothetical protein